MIVAIRVDSSIKIGTGHVMRCVTLANALRDRGATCYFICRPLHGFPLAVVRHCGHDVLALPELQDYAHPVCNSTSYSNWLGTDWAVDARDTLDALTARMGRQPVDWLVVDHYALGACWEEVLYTKAKRIMVIDDLADRPHACDMLLDQNLGRTEADYRDLLNGKITTLVGPKYALLRPEFAAMRAKSLTRRRQEPRLRRLLVTMGGVDKDNASGQVLAALQNCNLPLDLRITVVMGPHAPWLAQVQAQAAQVPWDTEVLVGVDNMAQLMANSDLAIGAAGGTAWERCSLGLPSLVLVLAPNQLPGAVALQKAGAAVAMESQQQITSFFASQQLASETEEVLSKLSQAAAAVTDGGGCKRIVKHMLEGAHG